MPVEARAGGRALGYGGMMVWSWFIVGVLACSPKQVPVSLPAPPPPAAAVGEGAAREYATVGPLEGRLSPAPADLVIFYGGEHKGSMATCGCPHRPRGSLARFAGYADAAQRSTPSLRVHTGYALQDDIGYDARPRPDAVLGNQWMQRGLAAGAWDALNATGFEAAAFTRAPPDPSLPWVSANVAGPGIRRWVVLERGGRKIGVTGVSGEAPTMSDPVGYTFSAPESAGPTLIELAAQVDVVVLLAWQANDAVRKLLKAAPGVDVVIDGGLYSDAYAPTFVKGTLWTFSVHQTVRLGELRLKLDGGEIRGALDRQVDLDELIPDAPPVAAVAGEASVALDAAQRTLYGD